MTIGHVHLRTADIDRVRAFYVDVLGFDVVAEARDVPGWGTTGDMLFVVGRRLPPPPRLQHLEVGRRRPAARRRRRPAPRRDPLPDARGPGRRAAPAAERSTGPCARSPTTARTRRSTSPTPTATTSSCAGTARSTSGRGTRTARLDMRGAFGRARPRRPAEGARAGSGRCSQLGGGRGRVCQRPPAAPQQHETPGQMPGARVQGRRCMSLWHSAQYVADEERGINRRRNAVRRGLYPESIQIADPRLNANTAPVSRSWRSAGAGTRSAARRAGR